MSSPSVSLLAIVTILCFLCKCCISAPHPCCPGSQKVVSLMANYVGTFAHSFSNLGFVRAMFAIAASVSSHASNNSEWQALSAQLGQQISEIDSKCAEFGISIAKVPFDGPKGDHSQRNVPGTNSVISMPGLTGSHKH
ncbi:hypothetical protein niasHS_015312 [Heterodera schachtii]|uniref:Uncharacterized protein n=1 Tax=Heterodera schachtii TaxID=97005 RepID=A0ABD2I2P8_HETSC